jgi:hypothetical protein
MKLKPTAIGVFSCWILCPLARFFFTCCRCKSIARKPRTATLCHSTHKYTFPVFGLATSLEPRLESQSFPLLPVHSRCRGCLLFTWSHSDTHHSRLDSSGRGIGPSQWPLPGDRPFEFHIDKILVKCEHCWIKLDIKVYRRHKFPFLRVDLFNPWSSFEVVRRQTFFYHK